MLPFQNSLIFVLATLLLPNGFLQPQHIMQNTHLS